MISVRQEGRDGSVKVVEGKADGQARSRKGAGAGGAAMILLKVEHSARMAKDADELFFVMANETGKLFRYRQSAIYDAKSGRIAAVSGAAQFDRHAPYGQWVSALASHCAETSPKEPLALTAEAVPEKFRAGFGEWFAPNALWLPLRWKSDMLAGFIASRAQPWEENEIKLMSVLFEAYAHALSVLPGHRPRRAGIPARRILWRSIFAALAVAAVAAMFVPVPMTALGQMEVRAKDLSVLRSPLEGTVATVDVEPNAQVRKGQLLATLDVQDLTNKLRMAQRACDTEKARLQQMSHRALADSRYSAQAGIARATVAEHEAEVRYLTEMIGRAQIRAPFDGVAIFDSRQDLVGKPRHIGERIMDMAHPDSMDVRVWLSTADAMQLPENASIKVFLNTDPDRAVDARLERCGFIAVPRPEGFMAYALDARFDKPSDMARIGVRGVAKVYGKEVPLWFYLFRRPLAAVRQFFGI